MAGVGDESGGRGVGRWALEEASGVEADATGEEPASPPLDGGAAGSEWADTG